jgi:hypothetical protein
MAAKSTRKRQHRKAADRPLGGRPVSRPILSDPAHHLQGPVHGGHQVDLQDAAEIVDRIEYGLAGVPVDFGGQGVAGDAASGARDDRRLTLSRLGLESPYEAGSISGGVGAEGQRRGGGQHG